MWRLKGFSNSSLLKSFKVVKHWYKIDNVLICIYIVFTRIPTHHKLTTTYDSQDTQALLEMIVACDDFVPVINSWEK